MFVENWVTNLVLALQVLNSVFDVYDEHLESLHFFLTGFSV